MFKIGTTNQSARDTWVKTTLGKIPKGKTILDAGAGEQQYKKYCTHLKYTSQDIAQYEPKNLDEGLQMPSWDFDGLDIISDITDIPVKNNSFDAILCTEVFEHIINPHKAILEFKRILKKGGLLIITAPFASYTHFAPYHYATGFSKYYYEKVLTEAGFKIKSIEHNGNYFELMAQEIRRIPYVIDKHVDNYALGSVLKLIIYPISKLLLLALEIANKFESGSEDITVFGYHVVAIKRK